MLNAQLIITEILRRACKRYKKHHVYAYKKNSFCTWFHPITPCSISYQIMMNLVDVGYESSVEYVWLDTLWTVRFIIDTVISAILILNAGVTKRSTVVDSRSTRAGVRGFESLLPHFYSSSLLL